MKVDPEVLRYLEERRWSPKKSLEIKARLRLGTETRANFRWLTYEEKACRICGEEEESMEHVWGKCEETRMTAKSWVDQMNAPNALAKMWSIMWKRKRRIEEEENTCMEL